MIAQIIFILLLGVSTYFFAKRIREIRRNIKLGQDIDRSDNASDRWKTLAMVAIGQSKMVKKPISGILHILVYVGFVLINIEVLEIIIDGIFGTHRAFAQLGFGGLYNFL
ncbi:MAG: hypothetical protein ACJAQ5_000930, partial [Flavobacteriales bacterium]